MPPRVGAGEEVTVVRFIGRAFHALHRRVLAFRARRVALAAVVLLLGLALLGVAGYVRAERRAAEGDIDANRPADARRRLDRCLKLWPWSSELHRLAGRAARMDGDLPDAEAHLNRALKLHGEATESLQLEFLLLRAQAGDLDEVVPTLSEAVERGHPDSPMILETVARAYMVQLRYRPAYICLSKWIELRPGTARAYQWRGWVAERLDNHKRAAEDYETALRCDPDLIPPRLRLAELLIEDKKVPEAVPHLERLAQLAPDNQQVQSRLGICRFLQGDRAEARRLMEAALPHLPNDPTLLLYLARLDLQEGRYADAEKRLQAVFAIDPSDNEGRYLMISVYQLQGRAEDAARALREYNDYKARLERANALLKQVEDGSAAAPDDLAEIGEFLLLIGRPEVGRYWLERALQRDPAHQRSHRALAAYYEKKGDAASAEVHRKKLRAP